LLNTTDSHTQYTPSQYNLLLQSSFSKQLMVRIHQSNEVKNILD
jgi:hypothetical protein